MLETSENAYRRKMWHFAVMPTVREELDQYRVLKTNPERWRQGDSGMLWLEIAPSGEVVGVHGTLEELAQSLLKVIIL